MRTNLHILGGTGKMGTAFRKMINNLKIDYLGNIIIYCDGNKASKYNAKNNSQKNIKFINYSSFNFSELKINKIINENDKNVILNLRGVNNKKSWLNKPLESLEIQFKSCSSIVESDICIHPNTEIIHFSSQLCDLIESSLALDEICDGEDNYRRAYMISRLHQESMLTAYAFMNGIDTKFIRLPFVYGFYSDNENPWVLNSLIKQYVKKGSIELRKPNSFAWFIHKDFLLSYIINQVTQDNKTKSNFKTVSYLKCPMIGIKVELLAKFIVEIIHENNPINFDNLKDNFKTKEINSEDNLIIQIKLLCKSIKEIYDFETSKTLKVKN